MTLRTIDTPGETGWFTHDRFGLFIHWGTYALAARHEWVKSRERIGDDAYMKYFKHFDPDLYDPNQWAAAAAGAGMKYFVITTKHHEGFCLWDSDLTDYKATNTPHGRDLLVPMVDAFRGHDMKIGFYHSLIDWHHPQYVIDYRNHPRRESLKPIDNISAHGGKANNFSEYTEGVDPNAGRDQMKYADYLHGQVKELLSRFGKVDILWFDFSFVDKDHRENFALGKGREAWRSEQLYEMIRDMAPDIVLNDRLDLPDGGGWDVKTPEQFQPRIWVHVDGKPVAWEACQTFSGSWGYYRDEHSWRSTEQLIHTLIDCVSKGGNLLLNVGPTGRGEFDERALDRLAGIGAWMKRHDRSIYGCTQAPSEFGPPQDGRLTYHPHTKRMYVHLFAWPYKHVHLDGQAWLDRVEYAQFLHDGSEIQMKGLEPWQLEAGSSVSPTAAKQPTLTLTLPQTRPNVAVPVVELFLK